MSTKIKRNVEVSKNTNTEKKSTIKSITQAVKDVIKKSVKKDELEFGLYRTTYHYWRNWVKDIFQSKNIQSRFVKDEKGFGGSIYVLKSETDKIKKMLKEYQAKHSEEVDLWW